MRFTLLLVGVVLVACQTVQSAAVNEDPDSSSVSGAIKSQVKKAVAKGQPKIRRTIRLHEPSAQQADSGLSPTAQANSTVNNEGPINSVDVKPEISISTDGQQKQESPVPVVAPEATTEKLDDNLEELEDEDGDHLEEKKDKPKKKKNKGKGKDKKKKKKSKVSSKGKSGDDGDDDDDDDDGAEEDEGEKKLKDLKEDSSPKEDQPIKVSQEQNLVQQKIYEPQAAAGTTTTEPQTTPEATKKTPAVPGDDALQVVSDGQNLQQAILHNVGNTELVEMEGVGNKKVIKMTNSNNEELEERDEGEGKGDKKRKRRSKKKPKKAKKAKKENKCNHPDHQHHHTNKDDKQPIVQVNIQGQGAGVVPQAIGVPHHQLVQPAAAAVMGQQIAPMAIGAHVMQPMPTMVHVPYAYAPMMAPMAPMPYGYPQPPRPRRRKSKKSKKNKSNKTTTTTTTPAPTTTTEEPTTTTTTTTTTTQAPTTTTTEKIEWEMVRVPKRKLKEVITGDK